MRAVCTFLSMGPRSLPMPMMARAGSQWEREGAARLDNAALATKTKTRHASTQNRGQRKHAHKQYHKTQQQTGAPADSALARLRARVEAHLSARHSAERLLRCWGAGAGATHAEVREGCVRGGGKGAQEPCLCFIVWCCVAAATVPGRSSNAPIRHDP